MNPVVLVLGILVALVQALIWVPLVLRWRRRTAAFWTAFDDRVAAGAEAIVLPPEPMVYRGGTGLFSTVKGNGRVALTTTRLVARKVTGGVVEIPVAQIRGAHHAKVFLGSVVGNREHLVVDVDGGEQVGFIVSDLDRWIEALTAAGAA